MRGQVLLMLIGVEILYVVLGGLVFRALESRGQRDVAGSSTDAVSSTVTNITQLVAMLFGNESCVSQSAVEQLLQSIVSTSCTDDTLSSGSRQRWDVAEGIFFALTVVSTIGYGNLVPSTAYSRLFCCIFALCGIPLTLVMMFAIGERLNALASRIDSRIEARSPRCGKVGRSLVLFSLGFTLFVLLPSVVFSCVHDWSYGVSVYYSIITLTTVGFGDFVAGFDGAGPLYRLAVGVWIFVGLSWLSGFINSVQDSVQSVVTRVDSKRLRLHSKLNGPDDNQTRHVPSDERDKMASPEMATPDVTSLSLLNTDNKLGDDVTKSDF